VNPAQHILVAAIHAYRWAISPAQIFIFGSTGGCRFTPTCSQYAVEAMQAHGVLAGTLLATKRICRCHPWAKCGHDPVPEFRIRNSEFRIASKPTH
jgi:putative membrane protein insertion efficiency factor